MSRVVIVVVILSVSSVIWVSQDSRIRTIRKETESLRSGPERGVGANGEPRGGRLAQKPPAKSAARPASRVGSQVGESGKARPGMLATASDKLKVRELMEELDLNEKERERLLPLMTKYVSEERLSMEALLEVGSDLLMGTAAYAKLAEVMRDRVELESGAALEEIRSDLRGERSDVFSAFVEERRRNLLQLLADQEFEAWKFQFDLGGPEAEQAAYDAFYGGWQDRLASPLREGFTAVELEETYRKEREELLQRFAMIVSEGELKAMRSALELGHALQVRMHQKNED